MCPFLYLIYAIDVIVTVKPFVRAFSDGLLVSKFSENWDVGNGKDLREGSS